MMKAGPLDELRQAEDPARELLERLGWMNVLREALAAERDDEREVLLKGRLREALLRLNEWMTDAQADWVAAEAVARLAGGFDQRNAFGPRAVRPGRCLERPEPQAVRPRPDGHRQRAVRGSTGSLRTGGGSP